MKRVAIIQARMSSTRLPGKVLMTVGGKEIIRHVLDRISSCCSVDKIVVATTTNTCDEAISSFIAALNSDIEIFRGSEDDVLDRYVQAAMHFKADWIVRVTSDSPLIDPDVIDFVVESTITGGYDYGSNSLKPSMPDGLDVECISFAALKRAWCSAVLPAEREHVTPYIRVNRNLFRLLNVSYRYDYSALCWALDSPEDLKFMAVLAEKINLDERSSYSFEKVLQVLRIYPQIQLINQNSARDVNLLEQIPTIFSSLNGEFDNIFYSEKSVPHELSIL